MNNFITFLQIFGIGFSFGIVGPCFLACTPVLVTYVAASKKGFVLGLRDIIVFFCGRLSAYIILGFLAGLSAILLRRFISSNAALFFKPASGIISIILGLLVFANKAGINLSCPSKKVKFYNFTGLFILGFIIGITPCAPLVALLFEIVLISKTALLGAFYALAFGLGTFFSGLLTVGAITGIFSGLTAKLIKSPKAMFIFKVVCATLLILLGLGLIFGRYPLIYETI